MVGRRLLTPVVFLFLLFLLFLIFLSFWYCLYIIKQIYFYNVSLFTFALNFRYYCDFSLQIKCWKKSVWVSRYMFIHMIYMFAERWHLLLFVIKHRNKYKKEAHSNFNHKLFHILSRNLCLETARKFVNKDNKC